MRIRDIPHIPRVNGCFQWQGREIPAVHEGDGVGVALLLERSQIDEDFGLSPKEGLLFFAEEQWKALGVHFKKSDVATMRLLRHGWKKGPLPFTEKDVCDIVLIMLEKSSTFGPLLAQRVENKSRRLCQLLKEASGLHVGRKLRKGDV